MLEVGKKVERDFRTEIRSDAAAVRAYLSSFDSSNFHPNTSPLFLPVVFLTCRVACVVPPHADVLAEALAQRDGHCADIPVLEEFTHTGQLYHEAGSPFQQNRTKRRSHLQMILTSLMPPPLVSEHTPPV